MSRIGKRPVVIPKGVTITIEGSTVKVQGSKGALSIELPARKLVNTSIADGAFSVKRVDESREARMDQGLVRALVANMVSGVVSGFKKELDIVGVGYRGEVKGNFLHLDLGHSHPIDFPIPKGIQVTVEKQTHITISGADKYLVGETAAEIRKLRKPEPYKGKGVKYTAETIRRKVGKAAVGAGTGAGPVKGG